MAARKSEEDQVENETPSFEKSIVELQQIVGQLEDGSLPLEDSMQQFERGISLLRNCYQVLEQAEQRIEVLTELAEDGSVETRPFDAAATFDAKSTGSKPDDRESNNDDKTENKPAARKNRSRRGPTSDESLF